MSINEQIPYWDLLRELQTTKKELKTAKSDLKKARDRSKQYRKYLANATRELAKKKPEILSDEEWQSILESRGICK